MIKNYIVIALRNIWKRKTHAFINMAGLSLGIASCLLVFIYVRNEVTYDQFHDQFNHIYRLNTKIFDKSTNEWKEFGSTAPIMAAEFSKQMPGVRHWTRIQQYSALTKHNNNLQSERFTFADPSLFNVFTFPLVEGSLETFDDDPNSIILTEQAAERLFGKDQAVGKTLEMEFNERFEILTVRAVIKNIPFNSSVRFDMVLPFSKYQQVAPERRFENWGDLHMSTFLLLDNQTDPSNLERKLTSALKPHWSQDENEQMAVALSLQPMKDIHMNPKIRSGNGVQPSTSSTTSWVLIGIGGFLLLIACINFINLSIGMAMPRTREIGLRKVAGAKRPQIITQFLGESFIVCLFALLLAVALVDLFTPAFEKLTNRSLGVSQLDSSILIGALVVTLLITALLAGTYPALVVSNLNPIKSLKGELKFSGKTFFTKSLITVQFVLGIMFLLGSMVVHRQLTYIQNFDLGYQDKGLISVYISTTGGDDLLSKFRNELAGVPSVLAVSGNSGSEGVTSFVYQNTEYTIHHDRVDHHFLDTYGVKLTQGRNFDIGLEADKTKAIIVNEAFVKLLELKDPVGTIVPFTYGSTMTNPTIIGVMSDFHFASLHEEVGPMVFYITPEIDLGQFFIRIDESQTALALDALQDTWQKLVPGRPFQYSFVEDNNQQLYASEQKQKDIISYASSFALVISCLGLFGLTSLTVTQRVKEIGIRKVLGATIPQITWLVSAEFIVIVIVANVIAWPLSFYFINTWLAGFAFRISLGLSTFLMAGGIAVVIAFLTVSIQSLKSAMANPVNSLRNE